MDLTVFQALISTQDNAYKSVLEIFMKQTNEKLQELQGMVKELTRRLELIQGLVADMQHQMKELLSDKKSKEEIIKKLTDDLHASEKAITKKTIVAARMSQYPAWRNLEVRPGSSPLSMFQSCLKLRFKYLLSSWSGFTGLDNVATINLGQSSLAS